MTINDVEKLTGLTAKSIRYYESKNLIKIARNAENSYREYTEADVTRLRWIKMFRYLDFSTEEVGNLLDLEKEEVQMALQKKAETFSEQRNRCEEKQKLCLSLAKDYEKEHESVREYLEFVDFMESEEMQDLTEELKDVLAPNLVSTIVQSLMFLAPVFWLFYNIKTERIDMLVFNGILALIGTVLTTLIWVHYVAEYKKNGRRVKNKNGKMLLMIPVLIGALIAGLGSMLALVILVENTLIPEDYLFYEHGQVTGILMIWLIMIPVILICLFIIMKISKKTATEMEDSNDLLFIWNHLGKWRPVAIVVWLIGLYCCLTNFTVVKEDKIICYAPWDLSGTEYEYEDVQSIRTGFGDKNMSIAEYKRKGNFFYEITLDGKAIIFHVPSANENIERYEDTYLELEEFDQALVELGIPKEADATGWKNCDLDKQYVDRFLRIIELN